MTTQETSDDEGFPTGSSVPFPYPTPYPQQVALMDTMLQALQQEKQDGRASVLLLESPTGTGKSLSLACAAMAWLRHVEKRDLSVEQESSTTASATTGVDWLDSWVSPQESENQQLQQRVLKRAQESRQGLQDELQRLRSKVGTDANNTRERRENLVRSGVTTAKLMERKRNKKKRKKSSAATVTTEEPEDFCLDEYSSDREYDEGTHNDCDVDSDQQDVGERNKVVLSDTTELLNGAHLDGSKEAVNLSESVPSVGSVQPGSGVRKIIYAARTHSQLSQFVGELRRTHWGKSVRVVALGGRQLLCGNKNVKRHKTESAITEACLDLCKDKGCPLKSSKEAVSTLALHMLAQPSDIEDMARLGDASHTCAYYASRESLAAAEVVVLPYSMLLMEQARQAVGLSLKETLVIVDEAHNLPEALRSLHSSRVSLPVAEAALAQLVAYTQKYSSRLAGRNLYYLGQIRKCLLAFVKHLKSEPEAVQRMISPAELLIQLKLDNINLFKILRYLKQSRLPQKLLGFTNVLNQSQQDGITISKHVSSLSIVQSFFEKLTSTSKEGKIVTDWPKGDSSRSTQHPTLRYVLLHPSAHFQNILDQAHAVALVGGTLSPFAHVAAELLGSDYLEQAAKADAFMKASSKSSTSMVSSSLTAFTCDHVVPSCNVCLEYLSTGPSKCKLDFRHQSRSSNAVCDEVGRALVELCKVVPSGIVVFLPSYSYEAHLVRRWKATGLFQQLQRHKSVHREPKSSQQVELALEAYSRDAKSIGALLLSVVGGKMSEGINFANEMARCVMVVGLPYPDITDPELKEKMSNMDATAAQNKSSISGQAYYQNLCMRAVNQSVGRAIRHAKDYAAIVLADFRYSTAPRIASGLPQWLRRGYAANGDKSFDGTLKRLTAFFDEKKVRQPSTVVVTPCQE